MMLMNQFIILKMHKGKKSCIYPTFLIKIYLPKGNQRKDETLPFTLKKYFSYQIRRNGRIRISPFCKP